MENAQKIIDKIQKEHLDPIPRYKFIIKRILIWLGFFIFILIGALSFSVILYTIKESSFDLLGHIHHSKLEFLLILFPIIWLVSLLFFIIGSFYIVRFSKRSYRIKPGIWLVIATSLSITLGTLFFITGGAEWFEKSFANNVEIYDSMEEKKKRIWSMPGEGNLSGKILDINGDTLDIVDFSGEKWIIIIEDAFVAPMVLVEVGEIIKINGEVLEKPVFRATHLRPWGGFNYRGGKKMKEIEKACVNKDEKNT